MDFETFWPQYLKAHRRFPRTRPALHVAGTIAASALVGTAVAFRKPGSRPRAWLPATAPPGSRTPSSNATAPRRSARRFVVRRGYFMAWHVLRGTMTRSSCASHGGVEHHENDACRLRIAFAVALAASPSGQRICLRIRRSHRAGRRAADLRRGGEDSSSRSIQRDDRYSGTAAIATEPSRAPKAALPAACVASDGRRGQQIFIFRAARRHTGIVFTYARPFAREDRGKNVDVRRHGH